MQSIVTVETIKWLGISNLVFLLLVLLTCRCFVGTKIYLKLLQKPWFKKIYQFHCYFWWAFAISVFLHTAFAIYLFGLPF